MKEKLQKVEGLMVGRGRERDGEGIRWGGERRERKEAQGVKRDRGEGEAQGGKGTEGRWDV